MPGTTTRNDLSTLFGVGAVGQLSDAELLTRFTAGQGDAVSKAAFEVIVARHGPMVLGVCRRVLGDAHAAADAFQATFLILTRNATSVHIEDSLGRWLYGVCIRVARRARATSLAECAHVLALNDFDPPEEVAPSDPCQHDDLRTAIDEEIARLPGRYRSAVVLCYLEGLTQEQAARRLRCPLGTIQSRLHRARERLKSGLIRRGLAPTARA
jgi:RNA polymerase sigma factor (sigma-70 family)